MVNLCVECGAEKAIYMTKIDDNICKICRKLDKYTFISKTFAKKMYLITDDDLKELKPCEDISTYSTLATYYTKEDLINCACEVHNTTKENLQNVIDALIDAKKNKVVNEKIARTIKRTNDLEKALNKAGVELRDDSKLCKLYIDNKCSGKFTLKQVVRRMCQMKYLYDYCHMKECLDKAHDDQIDERNNGYFPDCSIFDEAEYNALRKYSNNTYPDVFPWQK